MGLLISVIFGIIGLWIFYDIIRAAVRNGVRDALREHDDWLRDRGE